MSDDGRAVIGGFFWGVGTIASSWMTLAVLKELALDGARADIGWGELGLVLIQPPATLAVLVGAALLWFSPRSEVADVQRPQPVNELGPYRTPVVSAPQQRGRQSSRRWLLAAGLLWSCIAYLGFLFHNSGC